MPKGTEFIIAIDAGGTMTDTFLVNKVGEFKVGKALTNPKKEHESFMESVSDAASQWQLGKEVLTGTEMCVYAGTSMLNAILTRSGRKTGLIVTAGWETSLIHKIGLAWLGQSYEERLHQVSRWYDEPLVPPKLTRGVTERILQTGSVLIPLYERETEEAVEDLLNLGVEVIAVCLLWSHINPSHEIRVREIAKERMKKRGTDIPVIISSEVAPMLREASRINSVVVEAYASNMVRDQLIKVEESAKDIGYKSDLLTSLSYGGLVNVRYPKLYETLTSGPIGGILGGSYLVDVIGAENLVCCDMGGTSFDVGIITKRVMPIVREPDYARLRFNVPMVAIDSIGAGTGQVIHVDPLTKRVNLGPESLGADVGVCFRGLAPTVGDCALLVGYLNPEYFLGGNVKLDKQKAHDGLKELADVVGTNVYDFASGIIDLVNQRMKEHLLNMLRARGYNPADYVLLCYGGAGPLHLWGIAEGTEFSGITTVPWAAAFSAFGLASGNYLHRHHGATFAFIPQRADEGTKMNAGQAINHVWETLEKEAFAQMEKEGFPPNNVKLAHFVYARYMGQLEDFEVLSPVSRISSPADMDNVISAFEDVYAKLFPVAMRLPEAGYLIAEAAINAFVELPKPKVPIGAKEGKKPARDAYKGEREVYYRGKWLKYKLWEMSRLTRGNEILGAAIIEDPMTTFVVPPGYKIDIGDYRVLWYKKS
jgi:acetone carboxylase beta subunit